MGHILIAEDDAGMRQFLEKALTKAGHEVTACPDGMAAWEEIEKAGEKYDLLLSDVVMPGIDGIDLAEKAGQKHPDLKVLFITGFAAVAKNKVASTQEEARFVSKPFHLGDLVAQVEELLSAKNKK